MSRQCRLYLISPPKVADLAAFAQTLAETLRAGPVEALQIRLKIATELEIEAFVQAVGPVAKVHGVALILNDNPELAAKLELDGVHIGQGDRPYSEARKVVGLDRIVGVTCHASRHLAMLAAEAGADYVAFGAFFPSRTKAVQATADLEILSDWQATMLTPCVAIGGIEADNCRPIVTAGADFLAVSGGIWSHPRGPAAAVRAFNLEIAEALEDAPCGGA